MSLSPVTPAPGIFPVHASETGAGEPLLFLHGFEGHPGGDDSFITALAENHRVLAPEQPGFGESGGLDEIDGPVDIALHLRELLGQRDAAPADVVGHSLGAMHAAELAAIAPQAVRKLVLIAPFGLWLDDQPIPDLFAMSPNRLQRSAWHDPESRASQQALNRLAGTNGTSPGTAIIDRNMNLSAAGKFLWPIPDRGLAKRLPLIKAPTLIITGASDVLIPPAYGPAFAKAIRGSRHVEIADAAHYPQYEQADRIAEILGEFLGS